VVLGGFSKAQAMTGWRVGWICAPEAVAQLCVRVHQYTMLCAPHVSQLAAVEALEHAEDDVAAMVADYDRRRRVFVKGLRELGLDCPEPAGAFYAFPSIRRSGLDSETFAERLLHEHQVAVVPGNVFGPSARATCGAPTPRRCRCWRRRWSAWDGSWRRLTAGGARPGFTMPSQITVTLRARFDTLTSRVSGGHPAPAAPSSVDGRPSPLAADPPCPGCGRGAPRTTPAAWHGAASTRRRRGDLRLPGCTRADIFRIEAGLSDRSAAGPRPDPLSGHGAQSGEERQPLGRVGEPPAQGRDDRGGELGRRPPAAVGRRRAQLLPVVRQGRC
jgi:hypothetical protein